MFLCPSSPMTLVGGGGGGSKYNATQPYIFYGELCTTTQYGQQQHNTTLPLLL